METNKLHALMEEHAFDVGFDAVGWTAASVSASDAQTYRQWLDLGHHAGMDYLERQLDRRVDMSPYRSALVLGISHAFAEPGRPNGGVRVGRVARYAWTPDYHRQLQPRLDALTDTLTQLGVQARSYVDHGPIMERALAGQAFLGWRAKSGMLVSQNWGAFLTLAVVLTDIWMEDTAVLHPDRCGRCTACIRACPTGAILDNRTLDARKCLSYLTIEHRGMIPLAFRKAIGDWLFGCDGCLEICPWSIKAGALAQQWHPDPELAHPNIEPWLGLTNRQFDAQYAHTAFARPRRKGMLRNACLVLGNLGDDAHIGLLVRALGDPAWEVREAAAWALGQFQRDNVWVHLEKALLRPEEIPCVRQTLLGALDGAL